MVRAISDNPPGFNRTLPTHTVEFDANYAAPWVDLEDITIDAAGNATHTFTVPDDDMIYFIDMISVTPRAYVAFRAAVSFNLVRYVYASATGWVNIPVRQNPSLQFVYGDAVAVLVVNDAVSQRYFNVILNGTKIPKPPGYTHGPF